MDKLKQYIDHNRPLFDTDDALPEGHLARFESLLEKEFGPEEAPTSEAKPQASPKAKPQARVIRMRRRILSTLAIAASLTLLIGIGLRLNQSEAIPHTKDEQVGEMKRSENLPPQRTENASTSENISQNIAQTKSTPITVVETDETLPSCAEREAEVAEVQLYYNLRIDRLMSDISAASLSNQKPQSEGLLQGSQAILADIRRFEDTELLEIVCLPEVFEVMAARYNANIASLERILAMMVG